jgi:hypothetical protein
LDAENSTTYIRFGFHAGYDTLNIGYCDNRREFYFDH